MTPKTKGKIISALRKLTWSYPPRNEAKAKQKRGPATFECEHCQNWIYEGKKDLSKLDLSPPKEVVKGKTYLDHKHAVIPLDGFSGDGSWNWDEFINRLFCETTEFQVLCYTCHQIKTDLENSMRKEYKNSKKKLDNV